MFSSGFPRMTMEKLAEKVASCCLLPRGLPLYLWGWLKEIPSKENLTPLGGTETEPKILKILSLFLKPTEGVCFHAWKGAEPLRWSPEMELQSFSFVLASHQRSSLSCTEGSWIPSACSSFSQPLEKRGRWNPSRESAWQGKECDPGRFGTSHAWVSLHSWVENPAWILTGRIFISWAEPHRISHISQGTPYASYSVCWTTHAIA